MIGEETSTRYIEFVPLDEIKSADVNPKTHSPDLGGSIARFGFADGPIMDERTGKLVAGHGRIGQLKAMKARGEDPPEGVGLQYDGPDWTVPVQRGWSSRSDSEAAAFLVAHNKIGEAGGWDDVELGKLLATLGDDTAGLGVDDKELAELLELADPTPEVEDPGADEPPAEPKSQRGEVYALGPHRLMCGDSTSAEDVAALLGGEKPSLCLTDPPYGVGLDYDTHDDSRAELDKLIAGFLPLAREHCVTTLLTPGNGAQRRYPDPSWTLCWFVPGGVTRCSWGFCSWQPVLAYGKDPYLAAGLGARPDTIQCNSGSPDVDHPCPKPLKLWEWLLERGQPEPGLVYDPFLGSGTTLIAAARTGRKCYGMEISPAYCDVIRKRWGDWARAADVDPGADAL